MVIVPRSRASLRAPLLSSRDRVASLVGHEMKNYVMTYVTSIDQYFDFLLRDRLLSLAHYKSLP